jgi:hypothetical protein
MKQLLVLGVLACGLGSLPAAAQSLTSFKDSFGDHIYYQGSLYQGSTSQSNDLYQLWSTGGMNIDMTQLPVSSNSGNPRPLVVGGATAGYDLASFVNPRGQHLYYIDSNGHLRHLLVFWNGSKNVITNDDLTAITGIPPAFGPLTAFSNARGEHLYTTGSNGHVLHLFWNGAKELAEDLTAMAIKSTSTYCAVPTGRLISFADVSTELVYYIGPGGHVCELAWYNGSEGSYDLTSMSGTPAAVDPNLLTGFSDSNGQHVVFAAGYQFALYLLNWTPSDTWKIESLQPLVAQPPASSTSGGSLTSFANSVGEQVYFVDATQHVNEINLTAWTRVDLTALSGGAPVTQKSLCTNPLAFISNDDSGGEDVFYVGGDQHVWGLHNGNSAWSSQDLTSKFGGMQVPPCRGTADLAVQQSVLAYPPAYGGSMVYVVQVQNNGPDDAYNVSLVTSAPWAWQGSTLDGVAFNPSALLIPGGGSCQPGPSNIWGWPQDTTMQCNLGKIPVGASAIAQFTWSIPDSFQPNDVVATSAEVQSSTDDPNSANNKAPLVVYVQ